MKINLLEVDWDTQKLKEDAVVEKEQNIGSI